MWSPSETARRAVLWNARLAISSGMRRVVKDMPRATERRLPEEKLKALRTSLPTAFDLIGDALSGYWVSAEQGSAALLAASRAINALASDVHTRCEACIIFKVTSVLYVRHASVSTVTRVQPL